MKASHVAWLAAHPSRTADWLRSQLDDGFDVHHVDGDRNNNNSNNLVLIESQDHTTVIHGLFMKRLPKHSPRGRKPADHARDGAIYAAREAGRGWRSIGMDFNCSRATAFGRARSFARSHDKPWPVDVPKAEVVPIRCEALGVSLALQPLRTKSVESEVDAVLKILRREERARLLTMRYR